MQKLKENNFYLQGFTGGVREDRT